MVDEVQPEEFVDPASISEEPLAPEDGYVEPSVDPAAAGLIEYDQAHEDPTDTYIASGVKSGDSEAELQIIQPIQKHPEISGLVRAVDPNTGWMGWVPYEEQKETPVETQSDTEEKVYRDAYAVLVAKLRLVKDGVFTDEEVNLEAARQAVRDSFKPRFVE